MGAEIQNIDGFFGESFNELSDGFVGSLAYVEKFY